MDAEHLTNDVFQQNKALQKWLGLSNNITDAQGKEPLKETIIQETKLGCKGLPSRYARYFEMTMEDKSISQQRLWLVQIRKGRQRYDQGNMIQDEFTQAGAFRDWLGL